MKRRLLLGATMALPALSIPGAAQAEMNVSSEGWRMGLLSDYSASGLLRRTGEGNLLLGNESSPVTRTVGSGKDATTVRDNPWHFSTDMDTFNRFKGLIGEYVAIPYRQLRLTGPLSGDSDYRVDQIAKVDPALAPTSPVLRDGAHGARRDGERIGRIVKATTKGLVSKTFEITMQVGNGGSQFIEMSVSDAAMYEAVVRFLRSGRRVKVTYTTSLIRNPLAADTAYDVLGIELSTGGLTQ